MSAVKVFLKHYEKKRNGSKRAISPFLIGFSSLLDNYLTIFSLSCSLLDFGFLLCSESDNDLMVFNVVFNTTVISRRPKHLFMLPWSFCYKYFVQYFSQATGYFLAYLFVEIMINGERGMNPVATTIINPWTESGRAGDSNQQPLRYQDLASMIKSPARVAQW